MSSFPLGLPSEAPLLTITRPKPSSWIIELHNGEDNRLTSNFITTAILPALDVVERDWRRRLQAGAPTKELKGKDTGTGSLILVGKRSQHKFFSNGLDFDNLIKDSTYSVNFFPGVYNPLMRRLLSFPIPIIAALNGHTFAAGMILALCCDYRVMVDGKSRNAWMCMNEVDFGAALPTSFTSLVRAKCPGDLGRKIFLEGHRFSPTEALEVGLVDHIVGGGTDAVLAKAQELAASLEHLPQLGGYGLIKRELYRDVFEASLRDVVLSNVVADDAAARARL